MSQLADGVATTAYFVSYEVHPALCDGTNSALAHGNKARVLKLRSSSRHASLVDLLGSIAAAYEQADETLPAIVGNADTYVEKWTIYRVITRMPHNCTNRRVRVMILHQLQQAGCHTWDSDVPNQEITNTIHVLMWVFCSRHKARAQSLQTKPVNTKWRGRKHDWVVRQWC